jgi:hypothetical protein
MTTMRTPKMKAPGAILLLMAAVTIGATGCGPGTSSGEIRGTSEGMRFSITADSLPPHAMDDITWRVTVVDAKTGQPIEGGQGKIWARTRQVGGRDSHDSGEGLEPAPELGTYLGDVQYIAAGSWQMGVQFRRDSTKPFGQINWQQDVLRAKPLGGQQ